MVMPLTWRRSSSELKPFSSCQRRSETEHRAQAPGISSRQDQGNQCPCPAASWQVIPDPPAFISFAATAPFAALGRVGKELGCYNGVVPLYFTSLLPNPLEGQNGFCQMRLLPAQLFPQTLPVLSSSDSVAQTHRKGNRIIELLKLEKATKIITPSPPYPPHHVPQCLERTNKKHLLTC